ncbi:Coenzyme F420 hydrogenase/dehydrogenase, beta subunit C-terminal domain [Methanobrevibacter sp. OttesenSCG-928-I08]|nr:Coenzyme F420 hydrogenase/dehydrogenase, beta subunit C-terminal domain [Methanobrevibacter sp. OttesenSCG-928-I08]
MNSEFLEIKSNDSNICEFGECGGAVTSLLKYLLEEEIVDDVLTIQKQDSVYEGLPTLISNPEDLVKTAGSLHCVPTMTADLISRFLSGKKIATVGKPCDTMAIDELKKRNQIDEDKIYTIGLNCGGTVLPETAQKMFQLFYEVDPSKVVKEEIEKGKIIIELEDGTEKGIKIDDLEEEGYGRRGNCQRCEVMIPRNADIACGNWGASDGWTFVEIITPKGKELVENAISKGFIQSKSPSEKQMEMRSKVENIMIKGAKKSKQNQLEGEYPSLEDWDKYWHRCIGCYGCRDVCPICWCKECEIEKMNPESADSYPQDPLMFQGIRLGHMSYSCVNCGQCEDVCPMEIPLSRIYDKLQKKYREKTGYIPGFGEDLPPLFSPEDI